MAARKLIVKGAISNPKKGEFYFIKNGDIYATTPNRKGGKKGRKHKCSGTATTAKKKATPKKKVAKKVVRKKAIPKKKAVARKSATKKRAKK